MKLTWKTPGEQTQLILDTVVLWIAGLSYGSAPVLDGYGMDMDMSLGLLMPAPRPAANYGEDNGSRKRRGGNVVHPM
jgi:hypothetical protein